MTESKQKDLKINISKTKKKKNKIKNNSKKIILPNEFVVYFD